jgi:hypothetical protein
MARGRAPAAPIAQLNLLQAYATYHLSLTYLIQIEGLQCVPLISCFTGRDSCSEKGRIHSAPDLKTSTEISWVQDPMQSIDADIFE